MIKIKKILTYILPATLIVSQGCSPMFRSGVDMDLSRKDVAKVASYTSGLEKKDHPYKFAEMDFFENDDGYSSKGVVKFEKDGKNYSFVDVNNRKTLDGTIDRYEIKNGESTIANIVGADLISPDMHMNAKKTSKSILESYVQNCIAAAGDPSSNIIVEECEDGITTLTLEDTDQKLKYTATSTANSDKTDSFQVESLDGSRATVDIKVNGVAPSYLRDVIEDVVKYSAFQLNNRESGRFVEKKYVKKDLLKEPLDVAKQ